MKFHHTFTAPSDGATARVRLPRFSFLGCAAVLLLLAPSAHAADTAACSLTDSSYRGWKSHLLDNGLIALQVVPEVGGRIMQYKLGAKEILWVNPQLAGKLPPSSGLAPDGSWLNYGGDKLWPAPQGWDNDAQWPGPPDAVLDGLPYTLQALPAPHPGEAALRLTSGNDPQSGIRFSRVIRIFPSTTRVNFEATMTNTDTKLRRWGIWAHTQIDAAKPGGGYNPLLNAWCPLNPKSCFAQGYDVIFGAKHNPSFQPGNVAGLMRVRYQVGKIGLDSNAGWSTTVNGQNGAVFAQRFVFESGAPYPDGSSVEFWLNGVGKIHAFGKEMTLPDDSVKNPYVMESEVLGPFASLKPGESSSWNYEWAATNIGGDFPVVDCTACGVVSEPLQAVAQIPASSPENQDSASTLPCHLRGRFGAFVEGSARVNFLDANGVRIGGMDLPGDVSPLKPLLLHASVQVPANASTVELTLVSATGQRVGLLASTTLTKCLAPGSREKAP